MFAGRLLGRVVQFKSLAFTMARKEDGIKTLGPVSGGGHGWHVA
jgi:hypothetical protein